MKQTDIKHIFTYLKELFPDPKTELHYSTPFQLVVAVMLSAQSTDIQVNKVTDILFTYIKKPEDLLTIGLASFERSINSINYYKTKTKHIYETAKMLIKNGELKIKNYKEGIPDTLEELMKFPGIGVKTAKVILHVLYNKPYIAVDTHVHRVSHRLGILLHHTPSKIERTKIFSPEKTSELLEKLIPDTYKDHAHHSLVLFGRYYCLARNPKCKSCKLQKICKFYNTNVIASKAKQSSNKK